MFKQALAVGKLVSPDADHSAVADGLAEAQFGQGKVCGTCRGIGVLTGVNPVGEGTGS